MAKLGKCWGRGHGKGRCLGHGRVGNMQTHRWVGIEWKAGPGSSILSAFPNTQDSCGLLKHGPPPMVVQIWVASLGKGKQFSLVLSTLMLSWMWGRLTRLPALGQVRIGLPNSYRSCNFIPLSDSKPCYGTYLYQAQICHITWIQGSWPDQGHDSAVGLP